MFSSRTQWLLALGLLTVTPCQGRAVEDIEKRAGDLQARASATINVGPIITAAAMAACSSGTIANPTADNWNNFQIDDWFQNFWSTQATDPKWDQNSEATVPYILEHVYGRTDLSCAEKDSCTSNIGDCSSWLQTAPNGPFDAIQAYVFYYGWAQLQSLYVTTSLTEGQISVATTDIASKFGNPNGGSPPWDKYGKKLGPALGAISGILGAYGAASGVFGALSGLAASIINAVALGDPAPQDPRVTDTNEIQQALWTMFDGLNYGITQTYEAIVIYNNGSGGGYPSLQSVLQGGNFADAGVGNTDIEELDNTSVTSSVQNAATNIFLYTAVNTLWRDADVFIVYLPYNVPIDQYNPFTADDCNTLIKTNSWKYVSCNGDGMALLVGDVSQTFGSGNPPGVDLTSIETDIPFSWQDAVDSSVSGWLSGGFNANPVLNSYETGGAVTITSLDDLQALSATDKKTPGLFNIPVCQVYILGSVYTENVDNTPGGGSEVVWLFAGLC